MIWSKFQRILFIKEVPDSKTDGALAQYHQRNYFTFNINERRFENIFQISLNQDIKIFVIQEMR